MGLIVDLPRWRERLAGGGVQVSQPAGRGGQPRRLWGWSAMGRVRLRLAPFYPRTAKMPRFLTTSEAGRSLGLSGRILEKHRSYGTGPAYRKIGGRVVYAVADPQRWADRGARSSTSDPGVGQVQPARPHYRAPCAGPGLARSPR